MQVISSPSWIPFVHRVIAIGMQIPTKARNMLREQVKWAFERQKPSAKFPYV